MEPSSTDRYRAELKGSGALVAWGLAWVASLALARFGPEAWGESQQALTWAAVGINLVAGVGWIVAFARFLRTIDDLQRKIVQDALAAALGAGWVLGSAYVVADAGGLLPASVDFVVLPIIMGATFIVVFLVGKIRYR